MASQKTWLGNEELSFLWEQGRDVEMVLESKKMYIFYSKKISSKVPVLEKHLTDLDFQVKDDGITLEDGLEDEKYVLYNDMTYNWRAFRIARDGHLSLLDKIDPAAKNPTQCLLQQWRASKDVGIEADYEENSKVRLFWF